jgi:TonB-dependent starch-binding outer membrane protein SusC
MKQILRKLVLGLTVLVGCQIANAQNRTVSGKVTDSEGISLPGVSVTVKGTSTGSITDANGKYSTSVSGTNNTLVFSYVGYKAQEVSVGNKTTIDVNLVEDAAVLNEVVVVGYGTMKKSDLTGAIAQVKATRMENENPRTIQDMLRGNAPGLDISNNASPRGGGSFLIRGRASLTASTSPLIVVDGVIYPGSLSDINPNDIATIDILKDASSAAVFGARSANGVILLTTKKGKSGKPQITVNSNIAINQVGKFNHILGADDFLKWRGDVLWSMNGHNPATQYNFYDPRNLPSNITMAQWLGSDKGDPVDVWLNRIKMFPVEIANYKAGKTTNWEDILINKNAVQQDHTVGISGSTPNTNYYMSLGYLTNQGLSVGDFFKTIRARVNLENKIAKFLSVGLNIQYGNRDESSIPIDLGNVIRTTPYGQLYQDDGVTLRQSTNDDVGNNSNPFLDQQYNSRDRKVNNLFSSIYIKGDIAYGFSYQVNFTPRFEFLNYLDHVSALKPGVTTRAGISRRENSTSYQWQLDNILRWNKSFGKHNFDATFLINAEKAQSWQNVINAENYSPSDNLTFHNVAAATLYPSITSNDVYYTGEALMGRMNYNYNSRYFLTATMRRDGYSGFGQSNQRATFPSLALGWQFTDEPFLKNLHKFLDYGKLRVSYGVNGNREILNSDGSANRFASLSALSAGVYTYTTASGTTYNTGTVRTTNMSNPNLKWEKNSSYNFGFDFGILNSKVSGTIDYYIRTTSDLLLFRSLPNITGFGNVISNLGSVGNNGLEVALNTENINNKNFVWRSSFSFWTNQNKILKLYGAVPVTDASGNTSLIDQDDRANGWFIGKPISQIWDYKVLGVWQEAERDLAKTYGFTPGDFKLEDLNQDGKFTIDDRQFIGNQNPKFSFNMRNEFNLYKNFDFSFSLYGRIGQLTAFNEAKNVDLFYDRSQYYKRPYWTPENPINDYAKMMSAAGGSVAFNVWRKSSFVRLNNISLAYNLPKSIMSKIKFDSMKLYVNVSNAAVFTPWEYFDPESRANTDTNNAFYQNLMPRTSTLGLNITF